MAERVMTPEGERMLLYYPPFLRKDQTTMALCNAFGAERATLQEYQNILEADMIAASAAEHLFLYEAMLGLTINPVGATLEQRQEIVLAYMARAALNGTGLSWETIAARVLGTSWTYSVGGVNNSELTVEVSYVEGSIAASLAQGLLRWITPASMTINVTYAEGFILDESLLDDDDL